MVWPIYVIALGAGFVATAILVGINAGQLVLLIPMALLITAANMYKVRFCNNCGATVGLFTRGIRAPAHCSQCGKPLG
jgi:hypothetical protein